MVKKAMHAHTKICDSTTVKPVIRMDEEYSSLLFGLVVTP
jgi:hypothetical protein